MEFQYLGSTEVKIPKIGFGTWKYTSGIEPIQAAIDNGAYLIDTAEIYGSEETVGKAIRGRRQEVFLATKAAPRHFRRKDLIAAAEQSLRILATDYIDLYQLHWPNYTVPLEETMAAMEELADAGKIRFIGVSNFYVADLKRAQKALSKHVIVANQIRYSLIDRSVEQSVLEYCRNNHITVIAFSPLANGLSKIIANDRKGALKHLSQLHGKTEAQIALSWVIFRDNIVAIPKASSPMRTIENCQAAQWRLSEEEYSHLSNAVHFRQRSSIELALRRGVKRIAQRFGKNL